MLRYNKVENRKTILKIEHHRSRGNYSFMSPHICLPVAIHIIHLMNELFIFALRRILFNQFLDLFDASKIYFQVQQLAAREEQFRSVIRPVIFVVKFVLHLPLILLQMVQQRMYVRNVRYVLLSLL